MLEVIRFENGLNFQNACNHCVKIHIVHILFLSLFPRAAGRFEPETVVC